MAAVLLLATAGNGCTSNSPKKHYVLAEKLWADGNYASAVMEFDKVTAKEPRSKLGLQSLYRSASTQALFLGQYNDAIRKYRAYSETVGADPDLAWSAKLQIGDILYSKLDQFDRAVQHYQALLRQNPGAAEGPELLFRVGKGFFFQRQFADAIQSYRDLIRKYPGTSYAEKAEYEIGVTFFTKGEQHSGGNQAYLDAIQAFEAFVQRHPQSQWVPEAKFGIASCQEELDQLDLAAESFAALKKTYPSPNVIEIKLVRIRERKAQRSR